MIDQSIHPSIGKTGARVEPEFVSAAEGEGAAAAAFEIIERYGISHVTEEQRAFMAGQMKHVPLPKAEVRRHRRHVLSLKPIDGLTS